MSIILENIEKSYDRPVLKKINYTFNTGKIYVIKGVSGCGKTTLLNILSGLDNDYSGKVINLSTTKRTPGYIFQYSLLLSNITIMENLLLIKNDEKLIINLCESMGITHLLKKYPEQISGGERQKASIVRTLLSNPQIILADEPTASLDDTNSEHIAEIISELKTDNRIIIIATHEHYFDKHADEIIYLKYGEIDKVETNNFTSAIIYPSVLKESTVNKTHKTKKFSLIKYNLKRNQNRFRLLSLLPFIIMFFLIMFVSTIQNNFKDEYLRSVKEKYPLESFNIPENSLEYLSFKNEVGIYNYYSATENNITAYYLADKRDSIFGVEGMIEYGKFPVKNDEILVTREFLTNNFNTSVSPEKYIGETITFMGNEFLISGILFSFNESNIDSSKNENFGLYINSDIYYKHIKGNIIFIPYNTIKEFLAPQKKEDNGTVYVRAYYRELFDNTDDTSELRSYYSNGSINIFENKILKAQHSLDNITQILLIVFMVCFVISCLFIGSQINIELHYRRKELGFLQIFGLKKNRIKKILLTEYMIKIIASVFISIMIYLLSMLVYYVLTHSWIIFNPIHILIIFACIIFVYFLTVFFTSHKFFKQDVIRLLE